MYRVVLLSLTCVVVQALHGDIMHKCARFTHPESLDCCNKQYLKMVYKDEVAECLEMPIKPPSCERDICIATKAGYASSDGTIDKKALTAALENLLKDETKLFQAIKAKCIEGDVTKYGPPDFCDLMKTKFCIDMQIVADCPQWDEDGECNGSKNAAKDCLENFA